MDPIAAVSLVAAVCQLIDFGGKITSKTYEIYTSASNSLAVDNELAQVASQILDLSEKLRPGLSDEIVSICYTQDEQALADICKSCNDVAMELFKKLDKLKTSNDGSKWSSFRKAIRHAWSEKELEELSGRPIGAPWSFGAKCSYYFEGLQEIARIATTLEEHQTEASRQLQDHTVVITQVLSKSEEINEHHHKETRESIIQAIHDMGTPSGRRQSIQKFPGIIPALKVAERDMTLACEMSILKGLTFSTITDRYDDVGEAHLQTFEWIFERRPLNNGKQNIRASETKKWSNFVDWLRSGQGIYWINGKAASGKSTLMRYIYDHGQTHKELCAWSNGVSLATAGFFF
ncbi:hypothetical protein M7I_8072 [Glarea lozoyensis 74030]|uniref:Nephrocystin 3-like N-terminal domain-containing protein n=1 Tax=Glarea lozoyensis (strain ATCC 74030 / MF5533) TaxID=1104152 RepID=H0EZ10_GLAL7|nr:hypothetical protein M7I_8072 [Glarea lozoyensis 74030]